MTVIQTECPNRIAFRAVIHGARSGEVRALSSMFEKSATELKPKPKLLRCKNIGSIALFNVRTLNMKKKIKSRRYLAETKPPQTTLMS